MRAARLTGAGLGLLALLLVLVSARPDVEEPNLGASLGLAMSAPDVIEVDPPDPEPILTAPRLLAGAPPVSGSALVRNIGDQPVAVRFGLAEESLARFGRLSQILRLKISSGRDLLAYVGLPDLAATGSAPLLLDPGQARSVAVEAWIPVGAPSSYHAERVEAALTVLTEPLPPDDD